MSVMMVKRQIAGDDKVAYVGRTQSEASGKEVDTHSGEHF